MKRRLVVRRLPDGSFLKLQMREPIAQEQKLPEGFAREERHIQRRARKQRRLARLEFVRKQSFHVQRKFMRAERGRWSRAVNFHLLHGDVTQANQWAAPGSDTNSLTNSCDTTDTDYGDEGPSPLVSTDSQDYNKAEREEWYQESGDRTTPPWWWNSTVKRPKHYGY